MFLLGDFSRKRMVAEILQKGSREIVLPFVRCCQTFLCKLTKKSIIPHLSEPVLSNQLS